MSKRPKESLPEPDHPFARWSAGAAIGCWALAVQSFPDPWNKLGAIVSPGIGYIFGQILDMIISQASESISARKKRKFTQKMSELCKQRHDLTQVGANPELVAVLSVEIEQYQKSIVEMISTVTLKKKGS